MCADDSLFSGLQCISHSWHHGGGRVCSVSSTQPHHGDSHSTSSRGPIYGTVTGEQSRIVGDVRSLSGGKIVNASLILWIETESALAACPLPPVLCRGHSISSEFCASTLHPSRQPFLFFAGHFLYLLGKPLSSQESLTDKRLISSLIAESGPNCTLEATVYYSNVRGTNIEVATQTVDKAYTPMQNFVLQPDNQTSNGQ